MIDKILEILEDIGIHPLYFDGVPRSQYGDGWNAAVKELTAKYTELLKKEASGKGDTDPLTEEQIELAAKAICVEWGGEWDSDDEFDHYAVPGEDHYDETRPSKPLFRRAAKAALMTLSNEIK